jgi:antitoxin Phd
MARIWQLQEAKNKLSEVVDEALKKGPQIVTRRGKEAVVILSSTDYKKMLLRQTRLSQFFSESPLAEVSLDLTRDKSSGRKGPTL